ncbi:MAG: TonB-dependent receptor [Balneolaceae bacterium]
MKFLIALSLTIFFSPPAFAQNIDTLEADLGEVVVVGYEGNRSVMETPGAVSFVDAELIGGFDEGSLLYGLNTVPGVKIEQRAPGSYRVAIRGSSLRSPFGVRNVKIYWNGIPFTEPSGSTALNLLDVINMQNVEVIRGPAGSIYGAGNGGALLLQSKQSSPERVEAGTSFGSFGLQRYVFHSQNQFSNGSLIFNYANQQSDGYREQSFFNRETAELSGRFQIDDEQFISTSFLYSDLYYGIPGPLTREQFDDNPRQARQGNPFALGSVEANSSIQQEAFLAGISHDVEISENISNLTTLYGTFSAFDNPFNLDYKKDSRKSGGGRSRFYFDTDIGEVRTRFTLGGEYQAADYAARNFENDSSEVGALNFDDEIKINSALIFANAEIDLPHNFYFTAGLSYNRLEYHLNRLVTNLPDDTEGIARKNFNPEIIPRIGLLKKLNAEISIHGTISYGFSPPTIEEFRTNEGSINLNLEAEQGTNYEAGVRGNLNRGQFSYDITTFLFKLDETIVQQQSERESTVIFENAGNTDQFGIEAAANWSIIQNRNAPLRRLNWRLSYTYHDFEFKNYNRDGNDYSGNALTGVAPHTIVSTMQAVTQPGIYASISYNYTDKIPLNDANTVYSDPYHLLQSKIGFKKMLAETLQLNLFLGIDNLLDETYSLGNDLNAFGERYYQPAAKRNSFGGIKIAYNF